MVKRVRERAAAVGAKPRETAQPSRTRRISLTTRKTSGPGPSGLYANLPGDRKVVLSMKVRPLGYSAEQLSDFVTIVGPRYSPHTDTLRLVCEMHPTAAENRAHLLRQLNDIHAATIQSAEPPLIAPDSALLTGVAFAGVDSRTLGVEDMRRPSEADAALEALLPVGVRLNGLAAASSSSNSAGDQARKDTASQRDDRGGLQPRK